MSVFDDTGLTLDTYSEIKEALLDDLKASFGDNIKASDDSVFGMLASIVSELLSDLSEDIQKTKSAFDPNAASGSSLSNLVMLNGLTRNEAEYSTVTLECTANNKGCTIPAGSLVSDPDDSDIQFATDIELVLAPSTSGNVSATAVDTGAIEASNDTLTQIDTPIFGWDSVSNPSSATAGQTEETDTALRLRRKFASLQVGQCSISAIYTAIANLDSVEVLRIYENNGETTDSNGVPPQHIWAVVKGGNDSDIAQALFLHLAAGIGMIGDTNVNYDDPITGETYTITFERPEDVDIYIDIEIVTDSDFPSDGDDLIKAAIASLFDGTLEKADGTFYDGFNIGDDIIYTKLFTPINSIDGNYVSSLQIGVSTPTLGTSNITINADQIGVIDTANITITEV